MESKVVRVGEEEVEVGGVTCESSPSTSFSGHVRDRFCCHPVLLFSESLCSQTLVGSVALLIFKRWSS